MPLSASPRSPRSPTSPISTNIRTIAGPDTAGLYVDGTRDGELGWADPSIEPRAFSSWPDPPLVDSYTTANTAPADVRPHRTRMTTATTIASTATAIAAPPSVIRPQSLPSSPRLGWVIPDKAAQMLDKRKQRAREKAAAHYEGITLNNIVQGRTCRPISLNDFSTYLRAQRSEASTVPFTPTVLPDLMTTKTSTSSSAGKSTANTSVDDGFGIQLFPTASPISAVDAGDALDALNFVVACDRYRRRWRTISPSRRAAKVAAQNAPRPASPEDELARVASNATNQTSGSKSDNAAELALRNDLNRLLCRFIGSPESESDPTSPPSTPRIVSSSTPRLRWMTDSGLLSEALFSRLLERSTTSTHPDILSELDGAVSSHLSLHHLPDFLLLSTRNLGTGARVGRLLVAIVCLAIAITFTVLLDMGPSPLTNSDVPRYWRILTLPFYMAAIGYAIAFNTGVCVWLSIRGNIDMDDAKTAAEDDADEALRQARKSRPSLLRRSLPRRTTRCGEGGEGTCALCPVGEDEHGEEEEEDGGDHGRKTRQNEEPLDAEAQAAKSYRDQVECRAQSYHVAPELYDLMRRFLPRGALRILEKSTPSGAAAAQTTTRVESRLEVDSAEMKEVGSSMGALGLSPDGTRQDSSLTPVRESSSSFSESHISAAPPPPSSRRKAAPADIDIHSANASATQAVPTIPTIETLRPAVPSPSQRSVRLPGLPISLLIVRPPQIATVQPAHHSGEGPRPKHQQQQRVSAAMTPTSPTAPHPTKTQQDVAVPDWGSPSPSGTNAMLHIPTLPHQDAPSDPTITTSARDAPAGSPRTTSRPIRRSRTSPSTSKPASAALWASLKRWTGFAPTTIRVLDQTVRRAHQIEALKALAWCTGLTLLVAGVVLGVP